VEEAFEASPASVLAQLRSRCHVVWWQDFPRKRGVSTISIVF
jgi:hypothetical protein